MRLFVLLLVAAGLGVGFLREVVIAYSFGIGREVEVFRVATGLPTALSEAMMISLVSLLLATLYIENNQSVQAKMLRIYSAMMCFIVGVVGVGIITMPLQTAMLAPGFPEAEQAQVTYWGRFAWLIFLFSALGSPIRALLSSRGVVWPGAAAQLLRSAGLVGFLLLLLNATDFGSLNALVVSAILAPLLPIFFYLAVLRPKMRLGDIKLFGQQMSRFDIALVSSLYSLLGIQLLLAGGRMVERSAASLLGAGSIATLEYSFSVLMACAGLFSSSASILIAPKVAQSYQKTGKVGKKAFTAVWAVIGVATLVGVLLSLAAYPVTAIIFERGSFDAAATTATAALFGVHALALGPIVAVLLLNQMMILTGLQQTMYLTSSVKFAIRGLFAFGVVYSIGSLQILAYGILIAETAVALLQFVVLRRRGVIG